MDIRLKNRREAEAKDSGRIGSILILFLIFLGAATALAFYPWLREQLFANAVQVIPGELENGIFEGYYVTIADQGYMFDSWTWEYMPSWFMGGVLLLTAAASFILGLIRPFKLAERKVFSLPFGLVLMIGYLALAFLDSVGGDFLPQLAAYTAIGEFQEDLARSFYLVPSSARAAALALNYLAWAFLIGFITWFTISVSSFLALGFKRWFWERTLTGILLCRGRRILDDTCRMVKSVDFRDRPTRLIVRVVAVNFVLLSVMSCFWFFGIFGVLVYSIVLFFLLKRMYNEMQKKYRLLLDATEKIAAGNLDVEITEELGIFEPLKEEIEKVQQGFRVAVAEEVRSRSMKTELITNVSHDLKTPLTAIITYIDLLKQEDITEEERRSYLQILDQKSLRLKRLIEDLFEISKANSDNATLNLMEVDVVSLMKQVRLELDDRIRESNLDFRWNFPERKVIRMLDSEKTYRIFENLLVNIIKYAMPGTRAYVDIAEEGEKAVISMKNISSAEIAQDGEVLTERFVRGDASRNTEGSGLGLAIAKSFTELQKGTMEVEVEADLFKVRLQFF